MSMFWNIDTHSKKCIYVFFLFIFSLPETKPHFCWGVFFYIRMWIYTGGYLSFSFGLSKLSIASPIHLFLHLPSPLCHCHSNRPNLSWNKKIKWEVRSIQIRHVIVNRPTKPNKLINALFAVNSNATHIWCNGANSADNVYATQEAPTPDTHIIQSFIIVAVIVATVHNQLIKEDLASGFFSLSLVFFGNHILARRFLRIED